MVTLKYGVPITAKTIRDASEFYGLSTDSKPTVSLSPSGFKIPNGAVFYEMNTGDVYMYNKASNTWIKQ